MLCGFGLSSCWLFCWLFLCYFWFLCVLGWFAFNFRYLVVFALRECDFCRVAGGFGCLGLRCFVALCSCVIVVWLVVICYMFLAGGLRFFGVVVACVGYCGYFDGGFSGLSWLVLLSFTLDVGCGIIWFLVRG